MTSGHTARVRTHLVVKVTAGADAPERCGQGLTVASIAAASGVTVSLWLTGEAVWLGVPEHEVELAHSPALSTLVAAVLEAGTVTVCSQCAVRRELTQDQLLDGVRLSGAAVFVSEVMDENAQALVY